MNLMTTTALGVDNNEKSLIIKRLSESKSGSIGRVTSLFTVVRRGLPGPSRASYNGLITISESRVKRRIGDQRTDGR
jgi:hypothetical protein